MIYKSFSKSLASTALLIAFFSLLGNTDLSAQEKQKKEISADEMLARKAALKSAILPGWGQAQNGGFNYLKIPLIYGGLGALSYLTYDNHLRFKCYEWAYFMDGQGYYGNCEGFTSTAQLKAGLDLYHKRRDMFALMTVGAYLLQVLDAYVWAHLKQFDNSDDLSLNVYPSFTNIAGQPTAQVSLKLSFR